LIYQLIDQGKLSLDTKLAQYFPEVPNAKLITIGNLLAHNSGLGDYVHASGDLMWITMPRTKELLLDSIRAAKPLFAPGAGKRYSNSGYLLLSYIVEMLYKKPYVKVAEERIFKKMRMKNTLSGVVNKTGLHEAIPYRLASSWSEIKDIYFPNVIGVGDILSTPIDLLKFMQGLQDGTLISAKSLQQMKTAGPKDFLAMGFMMIPFNSMVGYGHAGDTYGTHCVLENFDKQGLMIAICMNGVSYMVNDINIAMLHILTNSPYQIPSFNALKLTTAQLDGYLGVYSSVQLPFKFIISRDGTVLMAEAIGQGAAVPMDAFEQNKFKYEPAGVVLEFNPANKGLVLKQGGKEYVFTREIKASEN
jgi:D-alanyl-D-alanine carboxypeptidase